MSTTADPHDKQHEEIKARVYAIEQSLAIVAQMLHALHKDDLKLGGGETERLLHIVRAMPGGSSTPQ